MTTGGAGSGERSVVMRGRLPSHATKPRRSVLAPASFLWVFRGGLAPSPHVASPLTPEVCELGSPAEGPPTALSRGVSMKRLALALAIVALGACQKADQPPAQQAPAAAAPAADTSHMMMADTAHHMMADTAKKAAAPAAKPAAKKPVAKKKRA